MDDTRLRLSAQRALLGAIGAGVRLIKIADDGRCITFTVVAAEPLDGSTREALSIAATEIAADFPDRTIDEIFIVDGGPLPSEAVTAGGWIYFRAE